MATSCACYQPAPPSTDRLEDRIRLQQHGCCMAGLDLMSTRERVCGWMLGGEVGQRRTELPLPSPRPPATGAGAGTATASSRIASPCDAGTTVLACGVKLDLFGSHSFTRSLSHTRRAGRTHGCHGGHLGGEASWPVVLRAPAPATRGFPSQNNVGHEVPGAKRKQRRRKRRLDFNPHTELRAMTLLTYANWCIFLVFRAWLRSSA